MTKSRQTTQQLLIYSKSNIPRLIRYKMYHSTIKSAITELHQEESDGNRKQAILRELDCFVLDNSLRESTVGQLKGHTLEDKWKIFKEVKKCGYQNIVVAAFSDEERVDDEFVKQLFEKGEDMTKLYAFCNFIDDVNEDGTIVAETVPTTLLKMKELKLHNPIIEIDLADQRIDWTNKSIVEEVCQLLFQRIEWSKQQLCPKSKIFVNLRDFPIAMTKCPERVLRVVEYISALDDLRRPLGLMYEEPTGRFLGEQMGLWTSSVREVMNAEGWSKGHLLVHVHQYLGLAESVQLECLKTGADGIWAGVCEEGAAFGHACSSITLLNLICMGNKKVLKRYNCTYLRNAAIEVTKITTGILPHPRQCLYGERALDSVFDFGGIAGGWTKRNSFNLANFFGEVQPIRVSTLSSTHMLKQQMIKTFGFNVDFTEEIMHFMKKRMIQDLVGNRKEEYMSPVGLALLFDRAGGHLNANMRNVIDSWEISTPHWEVLRSQLRNIWDELDSSEEPSQQGDDALEFETFFERFLKPYYTNIKSCDARKALKALDMDNDGKVEWSECMVYIKWAIYEYPDISDLEELLSVTFKKGLFMAMQDEVVTPAIDGSPFDQFCTLHTICK